MFGFIKNKLKFNKIVKMQFNQQIIFSALEGGEYIMSDLYAQKPPLTENFNVSFGIGEDKRSLQVLFTIDDKEYPLNIDTSTESFTFFVNFLEAICSFKSWKTLVYVSSTDNVNDFFYIKNIDSSRLRLIALLNVKGEAQRVDICIDPQMFLSEFVTPFRTEIKPFDKILQEAAVLEKYSPEKISLPL